MHLHVKRAKVKYIIIIIKPWIPERVSMVKGREGKRGAEAGGGTEMQVHVYRKKQENIENRLNNALYPRVVPKNR